MPEGTIKRLISDKGFGFIEGERGDIFFHHSALEGTNIEALQVGQRVEYDEGSVSAAWAFCSGESVLRTPSQPKDTRTAAVEVRNRCAALVAAGGVTGLSRRVLIRSPWLECKRLERAGVPISRVPSVV
jgi:CspA family cold shock protein